MKQLAIIGMGPRGLYALEQLLLQLSLINKQVHILVFEACNESGSGRIWHSSQPDSNWINTPEYALAKLKERPQLKYNETIIEAFPSYHQWCQFSQNENRPNTFPPRNKLGNYLSQRYQSLYKHLENSDTFKSINAKVKHITPEGKQLKITTNNAEFVCDDVLLTVGHQKTELAEDLKQWKIHSKSNNHLTVFEDTYPISQLKSIKNKTNFTIGIRGFGLAMIDVMRYLVINNYGNFKVIDHATLETIYYKVKAQHLKLVPFSLYGLPLVPKPLNKAINNWYKPTNEELNRFKFEIESVTKSSKDVRSISFLTQPFAKIAARIFMDLNTKAVHHTFNESEIETVILSLINDITYKHELLQDETIATYKLIQNYIEMALGKSPVSLDYCLGQVWRHCQPTLYNAFSHAKVDLEIIKAVVILNERSKRYSYGPPIESMQQILALIDSEVLTLDFVKKPEIKPTDQGFLIINEQHKTELCSVMINSVLDQPKLLKTKTTLIKQLLKDELIETIHPKFGIDTFSNAYVKSPQNKPDLPIAVLGRMAKGRLIGVDSISECFGPRTEDWAKSYVAKLKK